MALSTFSAFQAQKVANKSVGGARAEADARSDKISGIRPDQARDVDFIYFSVRRNS